MPRVRGAAAPVTEPSFVVDVPEGATSIDLGPILRPILRKLMLVFSKDQAHSDEDLDAWISNFHREHRRAQLIGQLRWQWISRYMLDTDWRRSHSETNAQYYPNKGEHHRWRPYVCVCMKEKFQHDTNLAEMKRRAVEGIAKWEDRSFEEVCAAIVANTSVVVALASLVDEPGRTEA